MNNLKSDKNQRLKELLNYLEIKPSQLAEIVEVGKPNVSAVLNDKVEMPAKWAEKLLKKEPLLDIHWLLTGYGEMLKNEKVANNLLPNNEPLNDQNNFSRNLKALMDFHKMDVTGLAPLIDIQPTTLTQLLEQQRGPSLALLLRLRNLWGINIDALLFQDLSDPENMQDNLNESGAIKQIEAILKDLEKLKVEISKLKETDAERQKEIEEMRDKVSSNLDKSKNK